MRLLRVKHFILTSTAIFSLFVSAISACACSHHEPVKVEASSCHSSSHEAPPVASGAEGSTHFEANCECYVRTPVPAVVAKQDDKQTAVEESPPDVAELLQLGYISLTKDNALSGVFDPPRSYYQNSLLASLPSRAPPRL